MPGVRVTVAETLAVPLVKPVTVVELPGLVTEATAGLEEVQVMLAMLLWLPFCTVTLAVIVLLTPG